MSFPRVHGIELVDGNSYIKNFRVENLSDDPSVKDSADFWYHKGFKSFSLYDGSTTLRFRTEKDLSDLLLGRQPKKSVRVASTAATDVSNISTGIINQLIDGVTLAVDNRVLVKDAANAAYNGIYVVTADNGNGTVNVVRSLDADGAPEGEVETGMYCFVNEGTTNKNFGFILTTPGTITLGTTELDFTTIESFSEVTVDEDSLIITGETISTQLADGSLTASGSGLKITDGVNRENFIELDNVPLSYGSAAQGLAVNVTEDGLEYRELVTTFEALDDLTNAYSGNSGKSVVCDVLGTEVILSDPSNSISLELDTTKNALGFDETYNYVYPESNYLESTTSVVDALETLDAAIAGNLSNINSSTYIYTSGSPSTLHNITHNLESVLVEVEVYVFDTTESVYKIDAVDVTINSANSISVNLVTSANIKVIVKK